jgi:alpha-tubulin suppressor-like RCC1 family protein
LGDGTATDRKSPVAVVGLTGVTALEAGDFHTCAVLTGGTVKCWGANFSGQVGDGSIDVGRLSPVVVPGLAGVSKVAAGAAHSCALLGGGTVRCWGSNSEGQLGDGFASYRLSPGRVLGLG